ncbi:hypothetical protein JTE90_002589 [Oedothorax gibbosus]|uniref:Uncharacterized protein n=1 Tax=Oedothorax gibbosus TaxID=931172 RepID=A0AAV6V1J5_9ARAC|nr:hypothetical protein JTE90_002589 [Oedothorax gibbosus]
MYLRYSVPKTPDTKDSHIFLRDKCLLSVSAEMSRSHYRARNASSSDHLRRRSVKSVIVICGRDRLGIFW